MNGDLLISFVVSLSNHERNRFIQRFPNNSTNIVLLKTCRRR